MHVSFPCCCGWRSLFGFTIQLVEKLTCPNMDTKVRDVFKIMSSFLTKCLESIWKRSKLHPVTRINGQRLMISRIPQAMMMGQKLDNFSSLEDFPEMILTSNNLIIFGIWIFSGVHRNYLELLMVCMNFMKLYVATPITEKGWFGNNIRHSFPF